MAEMWIPSWPEKFILASQKSLGVSISSHVTIFLNVFKFLTSPELQTFE